MGKPTAADIVTWADTKGKPADSPAYHRVTAAELKYMRQLAKDGKTQTEIAQQLGRGQSTISYWLNAFEDTTELATEYLRASAFRMAENVVEHGQARDHIQALKGVGVLEQERTDLTIGLAIHLPGMPFASQLSTVSADMHSLTGDVGSDNAHDVNQR